PGTLADAISNAAINDTIAFDQACTITLDGSGTPAAFRIAFTTLTIDGNGHAVTIDGFGGGIFFFKPSAPPTIKGPALHDGAAFDGNGGGAIWNQGTLTVLRSTITSNVAITPGGGGIRTDIGSTLTVRRTTFDTNDTADKGGAISTNGMTTIVASTFT